MERDLNCWEYMRCGREPGGIHAEQLGICSASINERFESVHGGKKAGRTCWVVSGTFGKKNVECSFARKYKNCGICDFYKMVLTEEGEYVWPATYLLGILEGAEHKLLSEASRE